MLFTRLLEIKEITANSVILTCSGGESDKWYKNKETNVMSSTYEVQAENGIVEGVYHCEYTENLKTIKHMFYLNVKGEETYS